MHNVRYDFSSCHIDVPSPLADEMVQWGRTHVPDEDLYVTQRDPTYGREDEIHTTILYGLHCETSGSVRAIIEKSGLIKAKLGKMNVFTDPFKFDVVMIEIVSEDLRRLNEALQNKVRFTNKHPIYNPHVTIAYVLKGKGWKYIGNTDWEGREFVCDYAVFSSKNGTKERIIL